MITSSRLRSAVLAGLLLTLVACGKEEPQAPAASAPAPSAPAASAPAVEEAEPTQSSAPMDSAVTRSDEPFGTGSSPVTITSTTFERMSPSGPSFPGGRLTIAGDPPPPDNDGKHDFVSPVDGHAAAMLADDASGSLKWVAFADAKQDYLRLLAGNCATSLSGRLYNPKLVTGCANCAPPAICVTGSIKDGSGAFVPLPAPVCISTASADPHELARWMAMTSVATAAATDPAHPRAELEVTGTANPKSVELRFYLKP